MIKAAIIGLGKMGISHLSMLNAHPDVSVTGVCDTSGFVTGCLEKVTDIKYYSDYIKMINECEIDCIMIATPNSSHTKIISDCLEKGLHIFVEKPFCLSVSEGEKMIELANQKQLVNQVGYHNKFIGAFSKVKQFLDEKVLGELYYIHGEAYGPVVLKPKGGTWRSKKNEGGGCLHDYASHVIDLMNYYVGVPKKVRGTVLKSIFSKDVEDAVYSTLDYSGGIAGQLTINWSEPAYRKMSTMITIKGKKGKIVVDRQELKIYLNEEDKKSGLNAGWNVLYTTELTAPVYFYLRGEEYSAQIAHFIDSIKNKNLSGLNTFKSAINTDRVVEMLNQDAN